MEMFLLTGERPLAGSVRVGGSKNAALPIMAAALACDGPVRLEGLPQLVDVGTLIELLRTLGVNVEVSADGSLSLNTLDQSAYVADYELVRRMRASVCVLGPLLGRRGRACVSLPGGCNIGHRPIDLHLKGLAALGADIRVERGYVHAEAKHLSGAEIDLAGPSGSTVTGTCNVMSAAVFARGTTIIRGAACEPEVVDLGNFLRKAGAEVDGLGTATIEIRGNDGTGSGGLSGTSHCVIPDRIEAATLLLAAAITRSSIELEDVLVDHLAAVIATLQEIGVRISTDSVRGGAADCDRRIRVNCDAVLRPVDVVTGPYPAFPTDVQAQLTALLTTVPGVSRVTDNVFPDRFMHLSELLRMGANINREGVMATIIGGSPLLGAGVMASDLRASAALVLAGLAARGETLVRRIYHLDRGYERLETKLTQLGASVTRLRDEPANVPPSLRPMV